MDDGFAVCNAAGSRVSITLHCTFYTLHSLSASRDEYIIPKIHPRKRQEIRNVCPQRTCRSADGDGGRVARKVGIGHLARCAPQPSGRISLLHSSTRSTRSPASPEGITPLPPTHCEGPEMSLINILSLITREKKNAARPNRARAAFNSCDWWRRRDSNSRPPRCERDALPTELLPHSWNLRMVYQKLPRARKGVF